jgi:RHS repeat-associated protein
MRSSSIGTTTTQPLTYSLDNLSIFYTYPYTIENCDNLADGYRFGFNGKEDDRETGTQDYGFRIYNPQLGKFLSVDPLTKSYPWYTPYQFAGNSPIWAVDLDGLEQGVVIRWYDNQQNWTGNTVFAVTNTNDRPLGQNTFLYLNLPNTQNNQNLANNLSNQVSINNAGNNQMTNFIQNNSANSTSNVRLTDFTGNAINMTDGQNNLTQGVAFTRGNLSTTDNNSYQMVLNTIATSQGNQNVGAKVISGNNPNTVIFDWASFTYNPNIAVGNSTNAQQMRFATNKLNNDPDMQAQITGNSSSPDITGTNNLNLSLRRSNAVFNLLSGTVNNPGQLSNEGGQSSNNAGTNITNNQRNQINSTQNATITFNIPLQSQ